MGECQGVVFAVIAFVEGVFIGLESEARKKTRRYLVGLKAFGYVAENYLVAGSPAFRMLRAKQGASIVPVVTVAHRTAFVSVYPTLHA